MTESLPMLNRYRGEKCPDMVQFPRAMSGVFALNSRGRSAKSGAFLVSRTRFTSNKSKINQLPSLQDVTKCHRLKIVTNVKFGTEA